MSAFTSHWFIMRSSPDQPSMWWTGNGFDANPLKALPYSCEQDARAAMLEINTPRDNSTLTITRHNKFETLEAK
jgi:hypothetical protein